MHSGFYSAALMATACLVVSTPAYALHKADSPYVTKGELEFEYELERVGDESGSDDNNAQEHELELSYGFTKRLNLALTMEGERTSEHQLHLSGYGLRGVYQLSEQRDGWLSTGIRARYFHDTRADEPDSLQMKYMARRSEGKFEITGNLIAEHEFGNNAKDAVELATALRGTYQLPNSMRVGLLWSADYGDTDTIPSFNKQAHYLGPTIHGRLSIDNAKDTYVDYALMGYHGITDGAADNGIRLQIAYGIDLE